MNLPIRFVKTVNKQIQFDLNKKRKQKEIKFKAH